MSSASERWRAALDAWAIPPEILAQAEEDPWSLPPGHFAPKGDGVLSLAHRRALEALPEGGSVIDVGSGGGAMSRPLRERAARIVAVDTSPGMLEVCEADEKICGRWPDVASSAGTADVVVCGHVLYNVPDLLSFVRALEAAAAARVVVEITDAHPLARTAWLWKRFWGLDRPAGPTWEDALSVVREAGVDPLTERWEGERGIRGFESPDSLVACTRRRLCLPASREDEVRAALEEHPFGHPLGHPFELNRRIVTIWWSAREV